MQRTPSLRTNETLPNPWALEAVDKKSPHFPSVQTIFAEQIVPIYGDQTFHLERIASGNSRRCELLLNDNQPVGLIAYLRGLQNENGVEGFEVRNLHVIQGHENISERCKTRLLNRLVKLAAEVSAKNLYFKIPEKDCELIDYLKSNGFTLTKTDDVRRHILTKAMEEPHSSKRKREQDDVSSRNYKHLRADKVVPPRLNTPIHPNAQYHELTLKKIYIHQIRDGKKTVEGRILDGRIRNFKAGDTIRFFYKANTNDDVTCKITAITTHLSFDAMLRVSGVHPCLPGVRSIEEGVAIYNSIPGYTQRARQSGVAAIHLEVLPNTPRPTYSKDS